MNMNININIFLNFAYVIGTNSPKHYSQDKLQKLFIRRFGV